MQGYSNTGAASPIGGGLADGSSLETFLAELVACNLAGVLASEPVASEPVISPSTLSQPIVLEPVKSAGAFSPDDLIGACMERVQAMSWGFVQSASVPVEADELQQIALLAIWEALARGVAPVDPVPYFVVVARNAMREELGRIHRQSTVSLNKPLTDENESFTLLDVLPAPSSVPDRHRTRRERSLHGAIRRLRSTKRRAAVRRCYGLEGYGEQRRQAWAKSLGMKTHTLDSLAWRAVCNLAKDQRLQAVVEVMR